MIFIDLETTGLLKPSATDLNLQPYITELYAVKLDEDYNFIAEFETFIKPPVPLPEHIIKITNITEEMLVSAPPFPMVYQPLMELFLGEREVVAHNCPFDMGVIYCELARMGMEVKFPWPPIWTCTVEKSLHLEHRRLTLARLHELATGSEHQGAHRARVDVYALVKCHMWMRAQGMI